MAAQSETANHDDGVPSSTAHAAVHGIGGHESFVRTPKQLIKVVTLALVLPVALIILLASYVVNGARVGAGSDAMTAESIEARIQPVAGFELRDVNAPTVARSGEQVYQAVCTACHAAGVAGAPKVGDKAGWAPRIASGLETLLHSALKGKGAMPPQGGGDFSDLEVSKAVVFMTNQAGATFEEPKGEGAAAKAGTETKAKAETEAK